MLARRIALVGVVVVVVATIAGPALARAGRANDEDQLARGIVEYLNAERDARGLAPLSWVSDSYAQQRADEQPNGGTDGHAGFTASSAAKAMGLEGARTTAETLYWGGFLSAGAVVRNWMASGSHRGLLMHPEMTHVSVGVACGASSLHAVAHVGVEEVVAMTSSPANPVVTEGAGPACGDVAPPAQPDPAPEPKPEPAPEPEPDPEPEPEPAPEPSAEPTAADPEPAGVDEVAAQPVVTESIVVFHMANVSLVEVPADPPVDRHLPRPSLVRAPGAMASESQPQALPLSRPLAPVIVGVALVLLQGSALAARPWRWRLAEA